MAQIIPRSLAWFKSIQCLHCNVTVDKIKVDWVYIVVDRALICAIQSFGMLSQIHQEVLVYACSLQVIQQNNVYQSPSRPYINALKNTVTLMNSFLVMF